MVVYRQAERLLVVTSVHGAPSMTVRDSHELASRNEASSASEWIPWTT